MKKSIFKYLVLLMGCGILGVYSFSQNNSLFRIKDSKDMLFMVEDTNVPEIPQSEIKQWITKEELNSKTPLIIKHFGELYKNKQFKLDVLLIVEDIGDRSYRFILRTYSKDKNEILDSFELATWDEVKQLFCRGWINKEFAISRDCNNMEEEYQLTELGFFSKIP